MDHSTLCVTGSERTAAQLADRLRQLPDPLHEVRLDLLDRIDDDAFALLASPRVVATCRRREELGRFQGTEDERALILQRALASRPGFLDVEASTSPRVREELAIEAAGKTRIVLSFHGADLDRARSLARERGDLLKVAVPVADAAELSALRRLLEDEPRPVLRIGMGDAGLLSRVLFSRFGSPWTYVSADGTEPTAPGQLSRARALALRTHEASQLTPLGVIGGPQVLTSNGQRVYNALFAAKQLPFHYLPVVSSRPEVLGLLEELGFLGMAVTMPAKVTLLAHVHELDTAARTVGALNTVLFRKGRRLGLNTDLPALCSLLPAGPGRALVLGAGGAARSAVHALKLLGWTAAVSNRTEGRAAVLGVRVVPWEQRGKEPFELLVNATPLGSDGASNPLPVNVSLAGRGVLDMVVARKETPLISSAIAAGAKLAIPGQEMWLRQGTLQLEAITGLRVATADLRGILNG